MTTTCKSLGKKIQKHRKEKQITTTQFAKDIGISAGQLSNIENGNYDVFKIELLSKICERLDIPLGELLQINSVNIKDLYLRREISKAISKNPLDSEEKIDFINRQINTLIINFLAVIAEYENDEERIRFINKHLIEELHFIKNLNMSPKQVSINK